MQAGDPTTQHLTAVLSDILLFFGIAGIAVPLLQRLKLSPVLAYLICGIVVGPYGIASLPGLPSWLSPLTITERSTVELLGELGIITLMFMIGLDLSFGRLKELRHYIIGIGTAQIIATAFIIFLVAGFFSNPPQAAILIGACFALSSTAIVMNLLEERRLINSPIGILCFSILLMQDLAVVPILVLATTFTGSQQESIAASLTTSIGVGIFTVIAIYFFGKRLLSPVLQSVGATHNPEWLAAFAVFVVVACASITHFAGLSPALGAFLAGLLIAETEFRHEVEVIINPLKALLLGIFFLSIGMLINLEEVFRHPLYLLFSVIGIYAIKAATLFPICMLFKVPGRLSAKAACYLAQPGEFALLVLGVAMSSKLIPASDVQFFLLLTTTAMLLSPVLFKIAPYAGAFANRFFKENLPESVIPVTGQNVVLIAGFGRVGQLLANALEDQFIPYIAFDHNPERVQLLKKQGFKVIYGDARKKALWQRLHQDHVIAAVIAIDDATATPGILKTLRGEWPLLPVIVRSKDVKDKALLYENGAQYVVAETQESSLSIVRLLLEELGAETPAIEYIVQKLRNQERSTLL